MSLTITQFLVGGLDDNCTYICSDAERRAVVVDPTGDIAQVLDYCKNHQFMIEAIWLTHTHFDHIDQIPTVQKAVGPLPIYVHVTGANNIALDTPSSVLELTDDQTLSVGEKTVQVLHTPGHSPDSVCFYYSGSDTQAPWLISGDTLFVHGCGRTTPEQAPTLFLSLQRLKQLPEQTTVYPGHDYGPTPNSTIAAELQHNQFLRAQSFEAFYQERFPKF